MDFPKNEKEIIDTVSELDRISTQVNNEATELKSRGYQMDRDNEQRKHLIFLLNRLRNCWREQRPAKLDSCFFFDKQGKTVLVREIIGENIEICPEEKWHDYNKECELKAGWGSVTYDMIPPHYTVVDFSDITFDKCGKCGKKLPLIEHYFQAYDGPEGDTWIKKKIVICLDCNEETIIEKKIY